MYVCRTHALPVSHRSCCRIVRYIYETIRIFLQIMGIEVWMNRCDKIVFVIRIMDKYHIRLMLLDIICRIRRDRDIIRKIICFIVDLCKASVRIPVIIRYRYHICVAVWILICCHPYGFKRIPHRGLVREKHCLDPRRKRINTILC